MKKISKSVDKKLTIRVEHYKEIALIGIAIVLLFGCIGLVISLEEDWTVNIESRQSVLVLAGLLFVGSVALCWYVVKTERKQNTTELQLLLIDRPPSYESIVLLDPPPPAYITVVNCYLPEATG
ncbi:hypothetical protein O3M35_005937 [Rhynocoris fuscipes]|uniref:Uncharacterized protein n=1 Tax=Rhynocoris fuscipes TaxID=488301 RepID=A0AAW1DC36_9HEMI